MSRTNINEVFHNGVKVSEETIIIDDATIFQDEAPQRLRSAYTALRQWSIDANVVANQSTNVSQAQIKALFDRFGKMADGLADLLLYLSVDR